jgi:phage-related protein
VECGGCGGGNCNGVCNYNIIPYLDWILDYWIFHIGVILSLIKGFSFF